MSAPIDLYLKALNRARQRMQRAKAELTAATQALYRRALGAPQRADRAIAELTAARRELNALTDETRTPRVADQEQA